MERRHLEYYVAIAEELHFGRAALRLGIATPTLSVQIQEIERRLGARLLDRSSRTVALTSAGEIFLREARDVLMQFERAETAGRRAGRGEIGRLALGYVGSAVFAGTLQEQLRQFRDAHPAADLQVSEWPMGVLPAMLDEGQLDLAFCRMPMALPRSLAFHDLVEDQFCVAVAETHPAGCTGTPVQPASLAQDWFVMPEQAAGAMEVARRGNFIPKVCAQPGHLPAVLAQVSVGVGSVAIVPSALRVAVALPGMVYLPIAGAPIVSTIAAVYRHNEASPIVTRLIEQITATPPRCLPRLGS
ncbi:MAG: HTH-type transcriptional regulator BenM [Stenotrophomonas maltophilia]|uniref:HTH-type transcriptional regulator BenM n=1 Tax=Stenotrophomonas maltophilia TaxID=40324 RepID=A0A7V8JN40_STEMA|nr:MAG: HTH-type transcriptional regulator BenM [Stenotrophomonas maltophilia]